MAISGFLFVSWRLFEIIMLLPPVGMLSWFVNGYVTNNQLTPNYILVLFIASVLALAWALATLINYFRARHDALFVAFIDLCFVGALIAGVVELRAISNADCSNFSANPFFIDIGVFGYYGYISGNGWALNINKTCAMLKASFAFGIICIIAFFVTFLLALLVHRNHKDDNKVVVRREVHSSRHAHRRSASRDYRGSRDYDSRTRSRSNSGQARRSVSRSRRQAYI